MISGHAGKHSQRAPLLQLQRQSELGYHPCAGVFEEPTCTMRALLKSAAEG